MPNLHEEVEKSTLFAVLYSTVGIAFQVQEPDIHHRIDKRVLSWS